jgi:xanthine/uracil permease
MLERSRKMYPLAAKAHMRSAIVLAAMAIVFIVFSRVSGHGFMSNYLLAFGVVMLVAAAFAAFNSRRVAKL